MSDNLSLRGVLDILTLFETLHQAGYPTPLDRVRRVVVFVVNSLSSPATDWAESENPPGTLSVLLKATGVPIDRYSGDQVEQLKDIEARWKFYRQIRESATFAKGVDPAAADLIRRAPEATLYTIDVSFPALADNAERDYLNQLPTSFVLPPEAVDRLRAAAAKIILESPDFRRLLGDLGAKVVGDPGPRP